MATALPILTIKYQTAHGEVPSTKFAESEYRCLFSEYHLPTLEADGMTFKGWSYNGEILSVGYEFYYDTDMTITLVAVWEEQFVIARYSEMVSVADAMRTATGTTGDLTFDQIIGKAEEVGSVKDSILAALSEKGVDTTGAGLADIAGLVAGIQAGGGGSSGYRLEEISTGSFTVAEEISLNTGYVFEHDGGRVPALLYIEASTTSSTSSAVHQLVAFITPHYLEQYRDTTHISMLTNALNRTSSTYGYTSVWKSSMTISGSREWTANSVSVYNSNYGAKFISGATYNWTLYAVEA